MTKTRRITRIALSVVLLMLGAQMTIPATPPFTLQLLCLFIISSILSPRDASITALIYLFLGAVGVPVFSGFTSGFGILFGVSGGFLISFTIISFFISYFIKKFAKTFVPRFTVFFIATIISYVFAFLWIVITKAVDESAGGILLNYVIPFLPFDFLKCALAPFIVKKLEGIMNK